MRKATESFSINSPIINKKPHKPIRLKGLDYKSASNLLVSADYLYWRGIVDVVYDPAHTTGGDKKHRSYGCAVLVYSVCCSPCGPCHKWLPPLGSLEVKSQVLSVLRTELANKADFQSAVQVCGERNK